MGTKIELLKQVAVKLEEVSLLHPFMMTRKVDGEIVICMASPALASPNPYSTYELVYIIFDEATGYADRNFILDRYTSFRPLAEGEGFTFVV